MMITHNDGRIEDVPVAGIIRELVRLVEILDERVKVFEKQVNGKSTRFSGVCLAPPTEGTCVECPACHLEQNRYIQCRINPPQCGPDPYDAYWPETSLDDWCYAGRELIARQKAAQMQPQPTKEEHTP